MDLPELWCHHCPSRIRRWHHKPCCPSPKSEVAMLTKCQIRPRLQPFICLRPSQFCGDLLCCCHRSAEGFGDMMPKLSACTRGSVLRTLFDADPPPPAAGQETPADFFMLPCGVDNPPSGTGAELIIFLKPLPHARLAAAVQEVPASSHAYSKHLVVVVRTVYVRLLTSSPC